MGAAHLEVATDPVFGLGTVPSPATGVALTQYRMPDRLDDYFPPDENVIPAGDNGVHSAVPASEPALQQVEALLSTRTLVHVCDGVCDPD